MLGKYLASPLLTHDCATRFCFSTPDVINAAPNIRLPNVSQNLNRRAYSPSFSPKKWVLHSTAEIENTALTDEERKTWEACQEAISAFSITIEEGDKILGKAFGLVHSPYWGEIRKKEVLEKEWGIKGKSLRNLLLRNPRVLGFNVDCKGDFMAQCTRCWVRF
ncbi:uncharacterized protein Pyn_11889 [Prunus yedoensis var. nudiflora]|uniref:Uncharacterized protein n=1 Tax=Prunus yedoensis var. nudiflora TaxID=2094558 RepID=A0A314Z577_PRUYE|nr:uncharacterized protein Pyn_11889 [Prunus yedoensis var. nudiflora]